jgi:hypothetical protein
MMSKILNYRTGVDASRSVAQIQAMLARHGVSKVLLEYARESETPVALSFTIKTAFGDRAFILPARIEAVERVLRGKRVAITDAGARALKAHAPRVAWRILKDWIEAQLAMVQAELTSIEEVMLPYMRVSAEETLYSLMQKNHLSLPAPKKKD